MPRLASVRSVLALVATLMVAALIGVVTGFAGRVLAVLGLYDVVAALALSVAAVTIHHLFGVRPQAGRFLVAALASVTWLAAHRVTDAWAFRQEQGQAVIEQTDLLAADYLVSGAETPLQLVDAGLAADTGASGLRGALLVQVKAGIVVHRAMGVSRVLPAPRWLFGLLAACETAFVTVLIARALLQLQREPVCATCGRLLRRRPLGPVGADELARLAQAWSHGDRDAPVSHPQVQAVAMAFEDACPAGHSRQPGYAALSVRSRSPRGPVPALASLPPETL
jgi:hypothetical protein